jgi:hypothetical protein
VQERRGWGRGESYDERISLLLAVVFVAVASMTAVGPSFIPMRVVDDIVAVVR